VLGLLTSALITTRLLTLPDCVAGPAQRPGLLPQAATDATCTAGERPQQIADLPRIAGFLDDRLWPELEGTIHTSPSAFILSTRALCPVYAL
jgi:hypothetical protein